MAPPPIWSQFDRVVKVIEMENTADQMQIDLLAKTGMLVEALPFMRRYSDKTILIKFGGHAMGKADYVNAFASDIALLDQVGARPVVVHGGGPQIGEMLTKLKIESKFIDGLRVTDEATISVVEMVLAGGYQQVASCGYCICWWTRCWSVWQGWWPYNSSKIDC